MKEVEMKLAELYEMLKDLELIRVDRGYFPKERQQEIAEMLKFMEKAACRNNIKKLHELMDDFKKKSGDL